MTKNKELAINEKKLEINFGITLYSTYSKPIYPKDYKSFDEFYNKIAEEWFLIFNQLYNDKKEN